MSVCCASMGAATRLVGAGLLHPGSGSKAVEPEYWASLGGVAGVLLPTWPTPTPGTHAPRSRMTSTMADACQCAHPNGYVSPRPFGPPCVGLLRCRRPLGAAFGLRGQRLPGRAGRPARVSRSSERKPCFQLASPRPRAPGKSALPRELGGCVASAPPGRPGRARL